MAIISFLPDELAIPISERLRVANEICQPMTDAELETMAYQAEEAYRRPPTWPLKFGRTIGSTPVSAMIQFNSIEHGMAPNYGLPDVGVTRQYQAYPPFPPLVDNNQALRQLEAARQIVRQLEAAQLADAAENAVMQQQQAEHEVIQADLQNQQLIALQQQQQQEHIAAAALLPRDLETPQQAVIRPKSVELHSLQMHSPQTDRLSKIESQIELLAITVKEGLAAAKTLSTRGASKESSQPKPRTTSGDAYSQTRSHSEEESRVSRSSGYSVDRQPLRGSSSSYSAQSKAREQSKSPGRHGGNTSYAPDRRSRRDDHSQDRRREKSFQARQTYPKMRKGENCSLDYDPLKQKTCSKCSKAGHHEFECFKYERYSPKKCTVCDKLNHFAGNCKELEKFPPKERELNCLEAGKNY
jgi:hypothetical protein